jgi:hypothetical protein
MASESDRREIGDIFVRLGSCLSLSLVAALSKQSTEDEAIEACSRSWRQLGEMIYDYMEGGEDA